MHSAGSEEQECLVPDASPAAFRSLLDYLCRDSPGDFTDARHAFETLQLARKHGVERLAQLCLKALLEDQIAADTAVPLLEAAHNDASNERLFKKCRRFIRANGGAVKAAGGIDDLQQLEVAKGLLGDAIDEVERLRKGSK